MAYSTCSLSCIGVFSPQCSTNEFCRIQDLKGDYVLDLEHEPNGSVCKSNGAAAVFNPKADPPTDSQQWPLHPLSNGHYLVVSKLHGKVLTYQIDEEVHRKCFVSNSSEGQDQQWMKEEDSIESVKYDFHVGRCVDVIADL